MKPSISMSCAPNVGRARRVSLEGERGEIEGGATDRRERSCRASRSERIDASARGLGGTHAMRWGGASNWLRKRAGGGKVARASASAPAALGCLLPRG